MARSDEPKVVAPAGELDLPEEAAPMADPRVLHDMEEYCAALERGEQFGKIVLVP